MSIVQPNQFKVDYNWEQGVPLATPISFVLPTPTGAHVGIVGGLSKKEHILTTLLSSGMLNFETAVHLTEKILESNHPENAPEAD